jgi:RHS repeat-associated protein
MKTRFHRPLPFHLRAITWMVIFIQFLAPLQPVWAQAELPDFSPAVAKVKSAMTSIKLALVAPARTDTRKSLPIQATVVEPRFSASPTDAEFFASFILPEPLVPMGRPSTVEENQALAKAMLQFHSANQATDDVSALTSFLRRYPDSPWRVGLLVNLGLIYRQTGYITRALEAWEEAWALGKDETGRRAKVLVDRGVGQLAEWNSRLGRYDRLETLLAELNGRTVLGPATENITGAREGLWFMNNKPESSFLCGPAAIRNLYACLFPGKDISTVLEDAQSTRQGTSLAQVNELAGAAGLDFRPAKRTNGAKVMWPSVVHWKAGHFAALIQEQDGRYLVKDPTFNGEFWVTKAALDEEGSGYFLVSNVDLPEGWAPAAIEEVSTVWGKGICNSGKPEETRPCDKKIGGPCDQPANGMARYSVHALLVSLNIVDIPISYTPPRGPSLDFMVTYNQREAGQAGGLNYPNIGSKWSFNWLAFIEKISLTEFRYVTPGGGYETYLMDPITGTFPTQLKSRSKLVKIGESSFVMTFADGSVEQFTYKVTGSPTRWYREKYIDPQGNALTYTFSTTSGLKLDTVDNRTTTSAESATARATLSYTSADPLKIETITIETLADEVVQASRSATLAYNTEGHLAAVTDAVGLVSQFNYESGGDFINALITPYGTTTFSKMPYGDESEDRWLTVTDPLGQQERYLYRLDVRTLEDDGAEPVPTGMGLPAAVQNLRYRNTFFWDKNTVPAVANWNNLQLNDYFKSHIFHWLHSDVANVAAGILESEKKPLENRIWYTYEGQANSTALGTSGNPIAVGQVVEDTLTSQVSSVSKYTYNDLGKVLTATDPLGRKTTYIYNANLIDLEEVRQTTGTMNERLAKITYNTKHQPLTVRGADGQKTTFTYNTYGQVETVVNAKSETTTFNYNEDSGFLETVVLPNITGPTPEQRTITFTPDSFYRVASVEDGDGYAVSYAYDNLDRPTTTTYDDDTTEQIVYKRLDPVLVKDRQNRWSAAEYDPLGRVVLTRDAQGRTTRFDYCSCDSLASLTDPLGQTTTWLRDLQGRVTDKIFPDASKQSFTYEPATGRLKTITDAKGQVTTYNYFVDNNLESVTYSGSAVYTPKVSFAYDPNYNRLTTMWDGTGKTTYSYKPISALSDPPTSGELTAALGANELKDVDGPLGNDTITYAYDELGRVNSRTVGGQTQSALFDALGRVTQIANPLDTFTYAYESASSRLTSISRTGQEILALTYFSNSDAQNKQRLQTILNKKPNGTAVSKFDYEYTADGQIKNWTRQFDGSGNTFYGFGYDAANQLLVAGLTNGTPSSVDTMLQQFVYSYDAAGNRLTEYSSAASSSTTRNHNNLNQLTKRTGAERVNFTGTASDSQSTPVTVQVGGVPAKTALQSGNTYTFDGHGIASSDAGVVSVIARDNVGNTKTNRYQVNSITASGVTKTFTYDLNGNTTSVTAGNTTDTYEWDAVDRMVAIERYTSGARVSRSEFTYDGLGRRVKIVEKDASGSVTSTKRFVWAGAELCQERNAGGGTITKQFFAQGELRGTTKYFYTRDHLGSVREVLDNTSAIVARYEYDPYGNRTATGSFACDFGYTGHYFHAPSGLSLALFRAYDSDSGRWLSRDPIGEAGGIHLYAYVGNNPINAFDPLGLDACEWDYAYAQIDYERQIEEQVGAPPGYMQRQREHAQDIGKAMTRGSIELALNANPVGGSIKIVRAGGASVRPAARKLLKDVQGIYTVCLNDGKKYVGKAKNIYRRLKEHDWRRKWRWNDVKEILVEKVDDAALLGQKEREQLMKVTAGELPKNAPDVLNKNMPPK